MNDTVHAMNRAQKQQAILARDLLQLAVDRWDDADIVERVSDYIFSLSMLFDEYDPDTPIQWHELFIILDVRYAHLREGLESPDTDLLNKARSMYDLLQDWISRQF